MGTFIDDEIIMSRRIADGGSTIEVLGPQGTGKTSLMLSYACRIMEEHPDEIIIWRDSYKSQCQFNRLKNYEIFAESGVDLEFRDLYKDELLDFPVTMFDDYPSLLKKMSPQQLNVVYVKDPIVGYIRLLSFLRRYKEWQSVFIDEYEDIAPLNQEGDKYKLIGLLGNNLKNIRKGLVSLFCNTQSKSQIDWRVRDTFMVTSYLSGAKVDGISPVYQDAVNSLDRGESWLSWYGKFGRINFPPVIPRFPVFETVDRNAVDDLDLLLSTM